MRQLFSIALFLIADLASAASFDCTKAKTPQEKAICASPTLSAADDRMATAYRKTLARIPEQMREAFRNDQREWLRVRAIHCNPSSVEDLSACLLSYQNERAESLQSAVEARGGITFVWRSIVLTEPDDERPGLGREVNPGYGTLTARWPQAAEATVEWKAWNAAIEADTQGSTGGWAAQPAVDDDIGVTIGLVQKDLITSTITYFEDGHGAHPNHGSNEFNWLIRKQRELRPDDVFAAGSGWEEIITTRTDQYLHRALEESGGPNYEPNEMQKALHGIVLNSRNWRLNDKGLSIVFQPYAVACYACTPEPFTMRWEELKPMLNPEFEVPGK